MAVQKNKHHEHIVKKTGLITRLKGHSASRALVSALFASRAHSSDVRSEDAASAMAEASAASFTAASSTAPALCAEAMLMHGSA